MRYLGGSGAVARVVLDLRPGSPRSEVEQEATTMPKQVDVSTKTGAGNGKVGSAYGPNPSGKPASNIHGTPKGK
jgi:hypothetical protein